MSTKAERYAKFTKIFGSNLSEAEWAKLKTWTEVSSKVIRLDTSIFPDTLEKLSWAGGNVSVLTIADTQTKLTELLLDGNHINKFVIPDSVKGITNLDLSDNPIVKFKFGGSLGKITKLAMNRLLTTRVRIPEGMTSLKELNIGAGGGNVTLPTDLLKLRSLYVVDLGDIRFKVPAESADLEVLWVDGALSGISAVNGMRKLKTLNVSSNGSINLPRLEYVTKLVVTAATGGEVVIPKSIGDTVQTLRISGNVRLPKSMPDLKTLSINTSGDIPVKIGKESTELMDVYIQSKGAITILPELNNLTKLTLGGTDIELKHGKTMTNLTRLSVYNCDTWNSDFPEEMSKLEQLTACKAMGLDSDKYRGSDYTMYTF